MPLFKDLGALLRAPVGNNLENNPEDVQNIKHGLAKTGHYKRPVENGYIDQELDDGLKNFQRDHNLKIDGIARPGGETEATLVSTLMKLPKPKPSEEDKRQGYQNASAVPLFRILGMGLGMSAAAAAQWWMNENNADTREKILKSFTLNNADENRAKCETVDKENRRICNDVTQKVNRRAGRACHESASRIYSECRRGTPESQWPPLADKF